MASKLWPHPLDPIDDKPMGIGEKLFIASIVGLQVYGLYASGVMIFEFVRGLM